MDRRRHDVRRRVLVSLGSLAGHFLVFLIALKQFQFFPSPPEQTPPMQVEIVPETIPPLVRPPPPPPLPPVPKLATPKPAPQPQLQPPQPAKPQPIAAKPQVAPKPVITATAPVKTALNPTLSPAPRPAPKPSELAPPLPSQVEGPPKPVPASSLTRATTQMAPAHTLILHKNEQNGSPLVPSVSIPGAVFAQPAPSGGAPPAGGQPGGVGQASGRGGGNFPGGALPGFGRGLRGGALGCMNAEALHLSQAEVQRCEEAYGANTLAAPRMDRIDASKRAVLDQEAAGEQAAQRYRDSMPTGAVTAPIAGQPRDGHTPSE
ncbi:MAG TPA: hypothetical protein VME40_05875 [Caulobacteraceae bacterium]|nr:hypothetical protein [Caulobacteraceae bacterium]